RPITSPSTRHRPMSSSMSIRSLRRSARAGLHLILNPWMLCATNLRPKRNDSDGRKGSKNDEQHIYHLLLITSDHVEAYPVIIGSVVMVGLNGYLFIEYVIGEI